MTGNVYEVMEKKLLSPHKQEMINTAEIVTQPILSQFSGQHIQTRLMYPTNVKSKVQSEVYSSVESVTVFSFKITTIKMLIYMRRVHGIDFFKTCGMKFPRISSLLGWKVKMNDGRPITNISRRRSCFGVNGYEIPKTRVVMQSRIVNNVFIKYSTEEC